MAPLAHMPQWQIIKPPKTAQHATTSRQEISLVLLKFQPEIHVQKPINQGAPQAAKSNMLQAVVAPLAAAKKKERSNSFLCR